MFWSVLQLYLEELILCPQENYGLVRSVVAPRSKIKKSGAAIKQAHKRHEQSQDALRVAMWQASLVLQPRSGPPVRERIEALRERVKFRERAARASAEV